MLLLGLLERARAEEFREFIVVTTRMGLPELLTEVGLAVDDDKSFSALTKAKTADRATSQKMPAQVTADSLVVALKSIEGLLRLVCDRERLHAPEPMTVR